MISTKIRYVLFMLCFLALSCQKEKEYSLATLDVGTTYYRNGVAISEVLDSRGMKIKVLTGPELGSFVNCRKIWNDEIDFAIAQNDTKVIDFLEDEMSIAESKYEL